MPTGTTNTTANDALKRAARTFVQTFLALFLSLTLMPHATPGTIPSWDTLKVAALAALWGAVASVLSFAQNSLEDGSFLPVLFGTKTPAVVTPKPADPVHLVEHVVSVAPVQFTVQQVLPDATAAEVSKVVEKQVSTVLSRAAQLPPNAGTTANPTVGETLPAPPVAPTPAPVEPPVVVATP